MICFNITVTNRTFASFSTQSMHSFHWSLCFLLSISKDGEERGAAMHKTLRHSPLRSNFPVLRISLKLNSKAFSEDKAGRALHQLARKRRKWTIMATEGEQIEGQKACTLLTGSCKQVTAAHTLIVFLPLGCLHSWTAKNQGEIRDC